MATYLMLLCIIIGTPDTIFSIRESEIAGFNIMYIVYIVM